MVEDTKEALVVFTPSGKRGKFKVGTSVLHAARELGVDLDSICGGRGICNRCRVRPSFGIFSKFGVESNEKCISEFSSTENSIQNKKGTLPKGLRLGCQALIEGDLIIDIPPESQVHKQIISKRVEARDIQLDPATRLYYVEVEKPDMESTNGDLERLLHALYQQWGLAHIIGDLRTLQILQCALRKGNWQVTVAVYFGQGRSNGRIINVWPGFYDDGIYGIALDIGSTTVAGHCCNLQTGEVLATAGLMNPQIRFGEDLMSRVSYSMINPGGADMMTHAIREAVNAIIGQISAEAMIPRENILEAVIVGNPVMHHLFLGIDPIELGYAPFALATSDALTLWGREVDLDMHPDSRIYVLPCIAGHVGADCAAVILSESPHQCDEVCLIIDVGTNAEIVLGNRNKLLACSSPTGPAFEGAQVSCGQRAAPGAIEHVRIDPETKKAYFKIIGIDLWSNSPDFEKAIEGTRITGICGSGIIEAIAEMRLAGLLRENGIIDGATVDTDTGIFLDDRTFSYALYSENGSPKVFLTQNDIRAIQLAKAALYAGAHLLMDELGVERIERIVLAGAFGSHISPLHAMILGMIPDCPLDKVSSAGNAAGTGARIALLNSAARREIEKVVDEIHKIETAVAPKFQEYFIDAMSIPHKTAPYDLLRNTVVIPDSKEESTSLQGKRRRRRNP